jgi:hypothetical protein
MPFARSQSAHTTAAVVLHDGQQLLSGVVSFEGACLEGDDAKHCSLIVTETSVHTVEHLVEVVIGSMQCWLYLNWCFADGAGLLQ